MNEILATFAYDDTGMIAVVFESTHAAGGFGVSLRDADADMTVASVHGFATFEAACEKAASYVPHYA